MKKILILEADDFIRGFVVDCLRRSDYSATEAAGVQDVPEDGTWDGAVVDAAFSEFCGVLRQKMPDLAILSLADEGQAADAVTGLMIGADEELKKPFSPMQLLQSVDKVLSASRAPEAHPEKLLSSGPFILDTAAYTLEKMDQRIKLTRPEYSMMKCFLENPGKALTQEEIYLYVWGPEDEPELDRVAYVVRRLRLKIEDDPRNPAFITTIWDYGYQWK